MNGKATPGPLHRGGKRGQMHTWMKNLNASTCVKLVMTKPQNILVALVNMAIFQMTLNLSLFTVDFYSKLCYKIVNPFCVDLCRHAECLQMYAGLHAHISWLAPFELV